MIDISSCSDAINVVKGNINRCFELCDTKGSTYTQLDNTTSELYHKIDAIPIGSGNTIVGMGQPFSGFSVTSTNDQVVTINCGSVGASWRGITVYSNSKRGFFTVYKVDGSRCVVSGMPWYYYDDGSTTGAFPYSLEATAAMCNYSVSGSSITLSVIVYSIENPADLSVMCNQINSDSNYLLDLIDVF